MRHCNKSQTDYSKVLDDCYYMTFDPKVTLLYL